MLLLFLPGGPFLPILAGIYSSVLIFMRVSEMIHAFFLGGGVMLLYILTRLSHYFFLLV